MRAVDIFGTKIPGTKHIHARARAQTETRALAQTLFFHFLYVILPQPRWEQFGHLVGGCVSAPGPDRQPAVVDATAILFSHTIDNETG